MIFYSIPFYSMPFYAIPFHFILFYSIVFYSILFYSSLVYFIILFYFALDCIVFKHVMFCVTAASELREAALRDAGHGHRVVSPVLETAAVPEETDL